MERPIRYAQGNGLAFPDPGITRQARGDGGADTVNDEARPVSGGSDEVPVKERVGTQRLDDLHLQSQIRIRITDDREVFGAHAARAVCLKAICHSRLKNCRAKEIPHNASLLEAQYYGLMTVIE